MASGFKLVIEQLTEVTYELYPQDRYCRFQKCGEVFLQNIKTS